MLPDRIASFLEYLDKFIETDPRASAHVAKGLEAFTEGTGARDIPEDVREMARGFAVYDYRDSRERNLVDLYLEAEGANLTGEERGVWRDLAEAEFGAFEVVVVIRGAGVTVRRLGYEAGVDVLETTASHTLDSKDVICCRLVRYRDHHEFTEVYQLPEFLAYLVRRVLKRSEGEAGKLSVAMFHDPRFWLRRHVEQAGGADSLMEAKLQLAAELPELCPGVPFEEVEDRIERMGRSLKIEDLVRGLPFRTREGVQRYCDLALQLYNLTPQASLGGRSPEEVAREAPDWERRDALRFDFLAECAAHEKQWAELSEEERREARAALQREWAETPQEELDGRTPAEVLATPPAPQLPPEREWPPADRPLWTREQLLEKLAHPAAPVREWALKKLEEHAHDPEIEERVVAALRDPDMEVRRQARDWITGHGKAVSPDALFEALAEKDSGWALWKAARWAPERTVALIAEELAVVKERGRELWLCRALGRACTHQARSLLEKTGSERSPFRRLAAAMGLYEAGADSFLAATRILGSVCAEKPETTKKSWKSITALHNVVWSGWVDTLELLPVHWIEEEIETLSSDSLEMLLRQHRIRAPRRFLALLGPAEFKEIQRCWDEKSLRQSTVELMAEAITASLDRSEGRDSVAHEELAGRIRVLVRALSECSHQLARLPAIMVRSFLAHLTAVMLKACHGRLFVHEVEACREDTETLLDLSTVELPFALTEAADALAAHGAAEVGDELITWVEDGEESFAMVRAIEAIARLARDPDLDRERAAAAVGPLTRSAWDYLAGPLELALPALGDSVLRHLPLVSEEKSDISEWFFLFVAAKIGTERALFAVRRLLPYLADRVSPGELGGWLSMLAHPSILPVMEELCEETAVPPDVDRELEALRILCGAPDYSHG